MKLKLLFVAVLISASVVGQNVPSYVPANGLVGWWPFNGNANDQSGNGNNGTVIGATLTTDRFGNGNSAYDFDGINNYVVANGFNLINGNDPRTFSFWVKYDSSSNGGWVISYGPSISNTPCNDEFHIEVKTVADCNFPGVGVSVPCAQKRFQCFLNDDLWKHIVIVYNGTGLANTSLYVNGLLHSSNFCNDNTGIANVLSTNPNFGSISFGKRNDNLSNTYFNGQIDDIGIWNRALTPQEITSLYQAQQPQCLPSYVPTNGLVGWYPFCGNANDESGNGNNGTVNGATLTSDRFGTNNAAYNFPSNPTFISLPEIDTTIGQPNLSATYSMWFKGAPSTNVPSVGVILSATLFPYDYQIRFEVQRSSSGLGLKVYYRCPAENDEPGVINQYNENIWHNITATADGSTGQYSYYFDGALIQSMSFNFNSINDYYLNNRAWQIGMINPQPGPTSHQFFGQIDDIGIWNRALTQQEITALYLAQNCNGGNTITPDGPTTFCAGNSVKMTSSAIGATYQWQRNGVNISGATTRRYKAVQGGSYTCVATCNGTPVTSNTIQLTWLENKPVTLSAAGSTAFCVGDSVTLNVTNPGTNYSIQWYRTNISLPGQTGTSLVVTQPGTYKVVTRNNLNGCSRISSSGITTTSNCRMADREVGEGINEDEELSSARVLENENSQGVKIYPNPNQGRFRFEYRGHESGPATVQVINSMGQQLHEQRVEVVDGLLETDIQLNGQFTSGIYIVRMVLNNGIHDSRVVVE